MSCRSTPAGSAWTTMSRLESGLTDVQTLSTFHALRREGRGTPAPTAEEWEEFANAEYEQMVAAGFSEARTRSLRTRMTRAMETVPDGATWHALRNIRNRGRSESQNLENVLRGYASTLDEDYDTVAGRYQTYLEEVDRGRNTNAPEGYESARDGLRERGLPLDHGTYTALQRVAAEAAAVQSTATERPRRVTPVPFPNSRAIHSAGYDPEGGRLEVTFNRRGRDGVVTGTSRTYAYTGVPAEVWNQMSSGNAGAVYNAEVRNHSQYRYPTAEAEEAGAHRRCTGCGQWWAPGHSCPLPAAGEATSNVPVGRSRTREEHLAVGAEINQFLAETPAPEAVASTEAVMPDRDEVRTLALQDLTHRTGVGTVTTDGQEFSEQRGLPALVHQMDLTRERLLRDIVNDESTTRWPSVDDAITEARAQIFQVEEGRERGDYQTTDGVRHPSEHEAVLAQTRINRDVERCPDCGQFMGDNHVCATPAANGLSDDAIEAQHLADEEDEIHSDPIPAPVEPAPAPEPEPTPEAEPEPVTPQWRTDPVAARSVGVYSRSRRVNSRTLSRNDPGYYDYANVPNQREIRAAAVNAPVVFRVSYSGSRYGVDAESNGGMPRGYFNVTGTMVMDRPGRGQWNVEEYVSEGQERGLRCDCSEYAANYRCVHVDYALARYRAALIPSTTRAAAAAIDPAAAQAAAEASYRADWMRQEETAAEARARHAELSNPEDSYTDNFAAFEADHNAALERKAAGEDPIPYMTENVIEGGAFSRENQRGFGVELEFDFPNTMSWQERNDALRNIGQQMYDEGLTQTSSQQGYHSAARRGYTDNHAGGWSFEQDCTVSGEIVSPVMYDEPETWQNIEKVCEIIRANGGVANAKTGSHVHVGAKSMTTQSATELMRMTNQHEDIMYRLSQNPEKNAHRPMRWCGPNADVPQGGYTEMYQVSSIRSHNYGMNLAGVRGRDSDHPEIRYWDGTLSPSAIQAQVKVSAGLVMAAERNASLGHSRRGREAVGSHARRMTAIRGRSRRALTSEELAEDTATVRSFMDTLFTRREDKAQIASLFAVTKWQSRR